MHNFWRFRPVGLLHPNFWGVRPWRRHGLVLLVAGGVYILIGLSYLLLEPTPNRVKALYFAQYWVPFSVWGMIFIFAGILAIVSSRWPPVSETWGYMLLTGLSTAWSMFYFAGVLFNNSGLANMSAVASWGLIAFLWWAISGLLNPADKTAVSMTGV